MRKIKLQNIKIMHSFELTPPSDRKMNYVRKQYLKTGIQDKPIVLNEDGYLTDGYARYLMLKEFGVEFVNYIRKKTVTKSIPSYKQMPTYYIYGIHSHCKNEFVWRVPSAKIDEFIGKILPGDTVLVGTKNGTKSITVTRIELLDKPPIDKCIKKVIKVI